MDIRYRYARKLFQYLDQGSVEEPGILADSLDPAPEEEKAEEIAVFAALLKRIAAAEAITREEMEVSYPLFAEDYGIRREMAKVFLENRECAMAIEYLEAISADRQARPGDYHLLAEAWTCLGNNEEADSARSQAEWLSRNVSAVSVLNTMLRSAEREEAIRGLELLVSREPGFLPAIRLLVEAYNEMGKKVEASSLYRNYLQAYPDDLSARETAARLLLDSGEYDLAANIISGHHETEASHLISAFQMIQGDNWSGAEGLLKMVLPENPLDPLVLYKLIQSLGGQGKIREARGYLEKGLKVYPSDPVLKAAEENIDFDYARMLSEQGRRQESVSIYRKLARLHPGNSQYLLNLGYEEMMNGEYSRAVESFRKGLKLAPGEDWARSGLAYCLMQEWEFDQAVEEMKIVVSRSDDPEYLFQLGSIYNQIGNTREGWAYIRRAARQGHAQAAALVEERYGKN